MAEVRRAFRLDPARAVLTALTVLFGLQCLRALLPLLVFIFRDRFALGAPMVGVVATAVFAAGFLAAPLRRALGSRRFLLLSAAGVGVLRLVLQLWTGDPLVDLALAAAGSALFLLALPALATGAGPTAPSFAFGWMLGLAADTGLHAAYGTWDVAWRPDAASATLVLVLALVQWRLLARARARAAGEAADVPGRLAWAWAAVGPFLFLELLILGNVARLAALTGWPAALAGAWTLAGQVLGASVVVAVARWRAPWWAAAAAGAALAATLLAPWPTGADAAWQLLVAQVLAAALLALVFLAVGAGTAAADLRRLSAAHGIGLLALSALLFGYYGGLDVRLPFDRDLLAPAAGLFLGLTAAAAVRSAPPIPAVTIGNVRRWLAAAALLALTPALPTVGRADTSVDDLGWPLRVMTYNLHCGIDPRGHLGLEAIAAAIEAQRPDVVALQEVSRGWVVNGSVDALAWLSRRLGMPAVFAATADPLWGNALLARRPILDHRGFDLPPRDLLIRRGVLAASLDLGAGGRLETIVTHHHHLPGGAAAREAQSRALVELWQGRPRTVVLGDFNALPTAPAIEILRRAGLRDAFELAGRGPGDTHRAHRPYRRIDYIWVSPDLAVREAFVPEVTASDHRPVVAVLESRNHSSG